MDDDDDDDSDSCQIPPKPKMTMIKKRIDDITKTFYHSAGGNCL
jgi:hypothetical protein